MHECIGMFPLEAFFAQTHVMHALTIGSKAKHLNSATQLECDQLLPLRTAVKLLEGFK